MNKITNEIFERAYQSYLCGGDIYTYRFSSKSAIMLKKYNEAIKYLEENNLIEIKFLSEEKVKVCLTEKGIKEGNAMYI